MNITPQAIQEAVKDMERQGSKIRRFQKYLQRQTTEDQELQMLKTLLEQLFEWRPDIGLITDIKKKNNILPCEYTKVYSIMLNNNGLC